MTELEILKHANTYLVKLANGFNPLTDTELPSDTILNNVRISRCLFYVSDILQKVIENDGEIGKKQASKKIPFNISFQQLMKVEISEDPSTISDFRKKIMAVCENENMKMFSATTITNWLVYKDFLKIVIDEKGKNRKSPTDKGIELGITEELRKSMYGNYVILLYSKEAQEYILENFLQILEWQNNSSKEKSIEVKEIPEKEIS